MLAAEAVAGGGDPGSSNRPASTPPATESIEARHAQVRTIEQARRQYFSSPLERAADAYLVQRGKGKTLIAGYPWFGDWGRDTFIALRGLCIATGHLEEARDILLQWAGTVSEGMLPNRFPDQGEQPEFNSVDASLWSRQAIWTRRGKSITESRRKVLTFPATNRHVFNNHG